MPSQWQLPASQAGFAERLEEQSIWHNRTWKPLDHNFPRKHLLVCLGNLVGLLWCPSFFGQKSVLTNSHAQTRQFDISPQVFFSMPTQRLQNLGSWGAPSTIHSTGGCPKPRPSQSSTCTWFFCCWRTQSRTFLKKRKMVGISSRNFWVILRGRGKGHWRAHR